MKKYDIIIFQLILKGGFVVDVQVGDTIIMKKSHPCGSDRFTVTRVGMDFKIKCEKCGHEVMSPRQKIEKNIRKIIRPEEG